LTWVVGLTEINFPHQELNPDTVTHPSTNRAWRRVTSLIWSTSLPIAPNRHLAYDGAMNYYYNNNHNKYNNNVLPSVYLFKDNNEWVTSVEQDNKAQECINSGPY